jgi:hypothetical protein
MSVTVELLVESFHPRVETKSMFVVHPNKPTKFYIEPASIGSWWRLNQWQLEKGKRRLLPHAGMPAWNRDSTLNRSLPRPYLKRHAALAFIALYLVLAIILALKLNDDRSSQNTAPGWALHLRGGKTTPAIPERLLTKNQHPRKFEQRQPGAPEVWARGPANSSSPLAVGLQDLLGTNVTMRLRSLCGRCLYRTLTSYVHAQEHAHFTVVLTGDIHAVWLRDSAVQMATYIPRVARHPALRQLLEGAIRAQAYFILQVCACPRPLICCVSACVSVVRLCLFPIPENCTKPDCLFWALENDRIPGPTRTMQRTFHRNRCPKMSDN